MSGVASDLPSRAGGKLLEKAEKLPAVEKKRLNWDDAGKESVKMSNGCESENNFVSQKVGRLILLQNTLLLFLISVLFFWFTHCVFWYGFRLFACNFTS